MKHLRLRHVPLFVAALSAMIAAPKAAAATDINSWDGQWHYDLAVYGWLPSLRATMTLTLPREDG